MGSSPTDDRTAGREAVMCVCARWCGCGAVCGVPNVGCLRVCGGTRVRGIVCTGPGQAAQHSAHRHRPTRSHFARVAKGGGLKIHWRQLRVGSSPTDDRTAGREGVMCARARWCGYGAGCGVPNVGCPCACGGTRVRSIVLTSPGQSVWYRARGPRPTRSHFARVAKGLDLRSTGGNSAWARAPQLTHFPLKAQGLR